MVGAALASAPLLATLPGCGGGTDSSLFTPPPANSQTFAVPVNFGNGQAGTLNLVATGTNTTGTLVVAPRAPLKATRSFTFTLPAGTYNVSGTFTPPRDFAVTGTFPAPIGAFSVAGSIPTTTQTGVFTVTANGQTATGTIPVIPTTGATPTPVAGATPTPRPGSTPTPVPTGSGHLSVSFSNSTINASAAPFSGAGTGAVLGNTNGNFNATYQVSNRNFNIVALNTLAGGVYQPFTVGQQLGFNASGIGFPGKAQIIYTAVIGQTTGQWAARSGSLTITAITSSTISYRLENVHFVPGLVNQAGTGSFTISGTGTAPRS
jgi:hypothetical protein